MAQRSTSPSARRSNPAETNAPDPALDSRPTDTLRVVALRRATWRALRSCRSGARRDRCGAWRSPGCRARAACRGAARSSRGGAVVTTGESERRDHRRTDVRWAPGDELEQRCAERVDVATRVDRRVAARLLGRHVRGRTHHVTRAGDTDVALGGDAEIDQLYLPWAEKALAARRFAEEFPSCRA